MREELHRLFEKMNVRSDSVVLLSMGAGVPKSQVKPLLNELLGYLSNGTLCVIGDCSFNTNETDIKSLENLSNRERLVLSSDYALQILSLRHDCYFAKHPSLSIGCVGEYAKYLARHQHLDFPYGKPSIFADLAELNATMILAGDVDKLYGLKHALMDVDAQVITKNLCIYSGELHSYLDVEVDFDWLHTWAYSNDKMKSENGVFPFRAEQYNWILKCLKDDLSKKVLPTY